MTSDGNATITEMGLCWSTQEEPTIYDEKMICPTSNQISTELTGLEGLTTYYLRAYAVNREGVAYSEEVAFTTSDMNIDVWDGTSVAEQFAGGVGTEMDPIRIESAAQLKLLADKVNSGSRYTGVYFKLGTNIDLAGKKWTPIGNSSTYVFGGYFDGNNAEIYGLISYSGLFGQIDDGIISNLTIEGEINSSNYGGMVCERTRGNTILNNISTNGKVKRGGGLVGEASGSTQIVNCINRCNVSESYSSGGIVGRVYDKLNITNCVNLGTIEGNGIAGESSYTVDITVLNCCNCAIAEDYGITYYVRVANNCFWLKWQNDMIEVEGLETGFGYTYTGEFINCGYFERTSTECLLPELEDKDVVEELNKWVDENGPSTYRRWKYEIVNGYACPVLE